MSEELMVDMGKYIVSKSPDVLVSLGLGSCVGVVIFDAPNKIGGLAHVMLPSVPDDKRNAGDEFNLDKFADIAIPKMLDEIKKKGGKSENFKAKMAGGAHMFKSLELSESMDIGKRNAEIIHKLLSNEKIPILSEETGGSVGRTVHFNLDSGIYNIKTKDGNKDI